MNETLLLARDGAVATLTLNRPESLNVLSLAMMDALVAHTASLANDATVRCVVIQGAGKNFMAGGDIRMFAERLASPAVEPQREFIGIVPEALLAEATAALASTLANGPALAMANGKRLINQSLSQSLSGQLSAEAVSFAACAARPDFAEGIRAFLDKRPPRFGQP